MSSTRPSGPLCYLVQRTCKHYAVLRNQADEHIRRQHVAVVRRLQPDSLIDEARSALQRDSLYIASCDDAQLAAYLQATASQLAQMILARKIDAARNQMFAQRRDTWGAIAQPCAPSTPPLPSFLQARPALGGGAACNTAELNNRLHVPAPQLQRFARARSALVAELAASRAATP